MLEKIKNVLSRFTLQRLVMMLLSLLVVILMLLVIKFFFFSTIKQKQNVDPATLCLYDGASNGVMIFIDQTHYLTEKQTMGIRRRVKKIAGDQVEQFGRLSVFALTPNGTVQQIGFACNPGALNKIENDWVDILGMKKKKIWDYYKGQVDNLIIAATASITRDAPETKIMEGMRDAVLIYQEADKDNGALDSADNESADDKQAEENKKRLNHDVSLNWLIVFSTMKEHRPDFSLRNSTAKTTPAISDFWDKNESLKLDLKNIEVGIYYFKDKQAKKDKPVTDKKNKKKNKKSALVQANNKNLTTADDASEDDGMVADDVLSDGETLATPYNKANNNSDKKTPKKKLQIKELRNAKFRQFWEDYFKSQGATVAWFRGLE